MSLVGLAFVAALALTQGSDQLLRLPPVADSQSFYAQELNETPQATYATFIQPPTEPPQPALISEGLPLPATRFTLAWLAAGGSSGFGMTDLDCNYTFLLGYDDCPPLNITPGLGMHLWSGPLQIDLPPRVYDLYLDFNWRPIDGERGGLSLGVTPGLYGDFERVDGDTFQWTGWVLGNLRLGLNWNVLGGLAYVRQLQSHFLPIGGVIWTPNDDTQLELIIPKPRFVRRYRADEYGSSFWYVAGQLGGGTWAVADTPTNNVLVGYTDLRVLLGIESFRMDTGREWNFEIGYVFARDVSVNGDVAFSPSGTVVMQASLAF